MTAPRPEIPGAAGGEAGVREALAFEAFARDYPDRETAADDWKTGRYGDDRRRAWEVADRILALLADRLAKAERVDALQAELDAVDRAFEGLEETDRARRIGHWIATAAAECTARQDAEVSLSACIADMERNGTCKRVYSDAALGAELEAAEAQIAHLTAERDALRAENDGLKARLTAWDETRRIAREATDAAERSAREREAFERKHPTCIGSALADPRATAPESRGSDDHADA